MSKILVVDDDVNNRSLVINTLRGKENPYSVLVASNGKMAVEVANHALPDLILMDWEMPIMNGIEALKILKAIPLTASIPVIMYTGIMTNSQALEKALAAGAIDFLRKPVEQIELLARVKAILTLQSSIQAQVQAEKDKASLLEELKLQELSQKTKELAGLALQIDQSHSFLNTILKKLELIQKSGSVPETKMELRKLVRLIENNINSEDHWNSLKDRIDSIYGGFLGRLAEKHPHLSNGDLKLCSFIKLNLTRKEIAEILGVTTEAIKKGRSRLRKKLELSPDLRLDIYLKQI
ncbi:response regulator [Aureispira sp. CCB-E]|uniref:response regulator n=1 Tax=Aureispira sp. CCB-E TaxID=3051121 RepID=UPI00286973D3|nr:response regulator [Aureispira sp. CCB-E]WMX13097.1 response regulator [Aureispira sp. CCB-E]